MKWLAWTGVSVISLIALLALAASSFDWNLTRPWINAWISAAVERRFEIRGNVLLGWRRDEAAQSGWRRFIPLPTLVAQNVVLGNPVWSQRSTMATVDEIRADVEVLPLLRREIALRSLALTKPEVALERTREGLNNWTFKMPESPAPWTVRVAQLVIGSGRLELEDAKSDLALHTTFSTLGGPVPGAGADDRYGVEFGFTGRYKTAAVEGRGQSGRILSLREDGVSFPLRIVARAGKVTMRAEGALANPISLAGLDLNVRVDAPSMSMLYPLTGIVLPSTPRFHTEGRLTGNLRPNSATWRYLNFSGRVGGSDLEGSIDYESRRPRPSLSGSMTSNLLHFADLGPLIGVRTSAEPAVRAPAVEGEGSANRKGKVLPDAPFGIDRWQSMDVDIVFAGKRIVREKALPIDNLTFHAMLYDGVLKLEPLSFGIGGGHLDAAVNLDGRQQPMRAELRANLRAVKLARMFPAIELMRGSAGQIDGSVVLTASGHSVAQLLGASSGEIKTHARDGRLSKYLLDAAALNVGSLVLDKLFGDKEVNLRCAAAEFSVANGIARVKKFIISTDEALIDATGQIDLGTERLALEVKPRSTGLKLLSLRSPLYVAGTFAEPQVGLQKGPLLLRAAGAAVLAVAAPAAAALLPVTVPGVRDEETCEALIAAAEQQPVAPAHAGGGEATAGQPAERRRKAASRDRSERQPR